MLRLTYRTYLEEVNRRDKIFIAVIPSLYMKGASLYRLSADNVTYEHNKNIHLTNVEVWSRSLIWFLSHPVGYINVGTKFNVST